MTINDRILTFFLNGLACAADARRNDRPKTVTVTVMYGFVVSWYLEKRVPVMWSFPRTFFFSRRIASHNPATLRVSWVIDGARY